MKVFIVRSFASWLLGFSSILYISIGGPLKVVDYVVILCAPLLIKKIALKSKSVFTLSILVFVTICSTLFNAFERNFPFEIVGVSMIGLLIALMGFILTLSLSLKEVYLFMKGYIVSTVIVIFASLLTYFKIISFDFFLYHSTLGSFITGTMLDPNRYGYTLNVALAMILFTNNIFYVGKLNSRIVKILLISLVLFALILTGSRSSLIISLVLFAVSVLIKAYDQRNLFIVRIITSFIVTIVGLIILGIFLANTGVEFYIVEKFQSKSISYTEDSRYYLLTELLRLWKESIILGIGLDGFKLSKGLTSHNSFAEILITSGILGFILYLYFIFRNFFMLLRRKPALPIKLRVLRIISILFFTLSLIYMVSLNLNFMLLFYLLLGLFSEYKLRVFRVGSNNL